MVLILKQKNKSFIKIGFALVLFFILGSIARAQIEFPGQGFDRKLNFTVSPSHPRAYDDVGLKIETSSANTDSSRITWFVDGQQIAQGTGKQELMVKTGALGSTTEILAILVSLSGDVLEGSIIIRPAEVDILWEANTIVPPFYRGKALYSEGSSARLVAMPRLVGEDGVEVPRERVVYKWIENGRVKGLQSGYGKSTYIVNDVSITRGRSIIRVEASSPNGDLRAMASALIEPSQDVDIVFYESSPLLGTLFEKALERDIKLDKDEITLMAQPYFFSYLKGYDDLEFKWIMNNREIRKGLGDKTSRLTFTRGNARGRAQITVQVESLSNILQNALNRITVIFE